MRGATVSVTTGGKRADISSLARTRVALHSRWITEISSPNSHRSFKITISKSRNECDQHWKLLQTLSTLWRSYCFVTGGRGVLQLSKATQGHRSVSLLRLQQLHGQTFSRDQPRLDLQLDDRKEK